LLWHVALSSHDEMRLAFRQSYTRNEARVERQVVAFNAVAKDHPIVWHMRGDHQLLTRGELTKDNVGL